MVTVATTVMTSLVNGAQETPHYRDLPQTTAREDRRENFKTSVQSDALLQLRANLAQLEDLHARMSFMMGELSYLLIKRG